ncbi:TonB-dependent receptor [Flavitalea flava]
MRLRICLFFLTILLSVCLFSQSFPPSRVITGMVRDVDSKEPLAFCTILLTERNPATGLAPTGNKNLMTGAAGKFSLIVASSFRQPVLIVSYSGYRTDTILIKEGQHNYIIPLQTAATGLNAIVVTTGVSRATSIRENPASVVSVSAKKMNTTLESNVIDVLVKNAPGLNAVKTGPNISKPFIRGLGYNRVLTLYDGIRQEGQQWGDEHGIEVDGYNIQRAEVIKGPASLIYGSDAVAGVISLFPHIPAEKDKQVHGKILSEYQVNNGLIGNGVRLGYRDEQWIWSLRGSYRVAKNYRNLADGRVYLTGFREKNLSGLIGRTFSSGETYLNLTLYDNMQGIPDGSRDSLTRKFTRQIMETGQDNLKNRPVVSQEELNSYIMPALHQRIQHYRAYSNHHYRVGKGVIDATLGFQQNIRREYNHPAKTGQPGLYVRLNTLNYGLRYNAPSFSNIEVSVGMNGMVQDNKNKAATDFPIPDYRLSEAGAFVYAKWKIKQWTISGGWRSDIRKVWGKDFFVGRDPSTGFEHHVSLPDTAGSHLPFPELNRRFSGGSFSMGLTFQISEGLTLKTNMARGYRAPNITEMASNGLDPGAHIVYLGDRSLVPEFSLQQDLGILAGYKDFDATASIFYNTVSDYIYLTQLQDGQGNPVTLVPGNKTFQYKQSSARLYGMEATLDIHPAAVKGLHLSHSLMVTYGENTARANKNKGVNGQYLPLIPPLKALSSISQDLKMGSPVFTGLTLKGEWEYTAPQNRYLALNATETATPGYSLVNLGVSTELSAGGSKMIQGMIQVNNIFDAVYQSNLSRLKYFEYYADSPKGRSGIYNMGRNICLKLILSF